MTRIDTTEGGMVCRHLEKSALSFLYDLVLICYPRKSAAKFSFVRDQQNFSRSLAAFEIAMSLLYLSEWIGGMDSKF